MIAIIQAGGKGVRLRPFTFVLPKPLMPVGDQPVLEIMLKWLRRWDVNKIYITTGYLGQLIHALCKDGSRWDMEINYTEEPEPLGTIGALRLIDSVNINETFIVINGDLITDLNLRSFINFHRKHGGLVTIATTCKPIKIDLGVLSCRDDKVIEFEEKPVLRYQVSMGIYCMEPDVLKLIPKGVPFGFDDLMQAMLMHDLPVYLYKHEGLWMDIGRQEDFQRANEEFNRSYKAQILGA